MDMYIDDTKLNKAETMVGLHEDRIVRYIEANGKFRLLVAQTTHAVEKARIYHNIYPTPCAALGRLLTGAALMSCSLKNPTDSVTLQIRCDGPIGGLVAVSDVSANVRGYAYQSDFDLPLNEHGKFDVAGAVGKGTLHVIKDIGLKDPYVGSVELLSGEIAEDLTWYYASSEQVPTVMSIGVLIGAGGKVLQSGGLLLQLMPEADEAVISDLETRISTMPAMTTLLESGLTVEEIVKGYFQGFDMTYIDTRPTNYICNCSMERMERNLISLGKKELSELSEDESGLELQCHFCSKKYHFPRETVVELTRKASTR